MSTYEIVVGNIGTVYRGTDYDLALANFREYTDQSKTQYGRAAGEEVAWFQDGELLRSYTPGDEFKCTIEIPLRLEYRATLEESWSKPGLDLIQALNDYLAGMENTRGPRLVPYKDAFVAIQH